MEIAWVPDSSLYKVSTVPQIQSELNPNAGNEILVIWLEKEVAVGSHVSLCVLLFMVNMFGTRRKIGNSHSPIAVLDRGRDGGSWRR